MKKRSALLYAAAAILAIVAAAGWMMYRPRPAVSQPRTEAVNVTASVVPPPVVAQGRIAVNAFPWANVTSVRDLDRNVMVDVGTNVTTPMPLDLAPGRYEVTLANPNFTQPITRTVSIASGGTVDLHVTFSDPASASLPDFGVAE